MVIVKIFSSARQLQGFALLVSFFYVSFNAKRIRQFARRIAKVMALNRREQARANVEPVRTDIALICYQGDCTLAFNRSNQPVPWTYDSMKASMEILPEDQYFMIRREIIVRGDMIEKVIKEGNAFYILLKAPFNKRYVVAKKRMAQFRVFGASNLMPWWNSHRNRFF